MNEGMPVAFAFDRETAKAEALAYLNPDEEHQWTRKGKLMRLDGTRWFWSGFEVLKVKHIGESSNALPIR
jgi:hypothetical protein